MREKILSLLMFLVVFGVIVLLTFGGVRYFLHQRSRESGKEVSLGSLEDLVLGAYLYLRRDEIAQPAGMDDTPVAFTIEPGETAGQIAARLEQLGLVSDANLFRLLVRYRAVGDKLEAGEFELRANMTMEEIITCLQRGRPGEMEVTIPEGWRIEQIAEMLAEQTEIDGDELLALAREGKFDRHFLSEHAADATLEGFLFPDTYRLPEDARASDLLWRMLDDFDRRFTSEMQQRASERGMTIYEVITLASIVEREAVIPEERPLIASVYLNRLAATDKEPWGYLQADPTVQYALGQPGQWWEPLTPEEYRSVDSPYNTYLHPGLPPGPICSPGLSSIQAVLWPAETNYLFFQAKGDGSHIFAETYEEHLENQKRLQQ